MGILWQRGQFNRKYVTFLSMYDSKIRCVQAHRAKGDKTKKRDIWRVWIKVLVANKISIEK